MQPRGQNGIGPVTIVVSPLISLMEDQVQYATAKVKVVARVRFDESRYFSTVVYIPHRRRPRSSQLPGRLSLGTASLRA